ncbi:MAG TPA: hypothetical protein VF587_15485 [Solirubrobacteraceae bacterium]|jgi:hypothetical protein
MSEFTLETLFRDAALDGKWFESKQQLEETFVEVFNRHISEMPPSYSYGAVLAWAQRQGWLVRNGKGGVTVDVDAVPQPADAA